MRGSFIVLSDLQDTRERFVHELIRHGPTSVGRELGVAGYVNAQRQFTLAIQGWEKNLWVRPFLTRLEGHFERSPHDDYTRVVFVTRGLTPPLTFVSLLIPYTVARTLVPGWSGVEPAWSEILLLIFSIALVPIIGAVFYSIERQTHRLLIDALLAAYGRPPLENQ